MLEKCEGIRLRAKVSKVEVPLSSVAYLTYAKAELLQVGIFFGLNFLPWEFLLIKKLEIKKTQTTLYTTFKTDVIKVLLVFSISNFLTAMLVGAVLQSTLLQRL